MLRSRGPRARHDRTAHTGLPRRAPRPGPDEIDAVDLPVDGVLPSELTGRYLRNGPNPLPGEDPGHGHRARHDPRRPVERGSLGGTSGPAADAAVLGVARLHRRHGDGAQRPVLGFPTLDDRLVGRESRYRYAVSRAAIVIYYEFGGTVATHALAADTAAGEAVLVPAQDGTAEDDGWLLTITTRLNGSASQLLVLDAGDVAGAPVATMTLPRGVPAGFHGSSMEDPAR